MPAKNIKPDIAYPKLVSSIAREMNKGVLSVQDALRRETVLMNWRVGRLINGYLARSSRARDYGRKLFIRLGEDLKIDHRTLYQCARVHSVYPKIDARLPLTWSHYRYLAQITLSEERLRWQSRIIRERLSVKDLLVLRSRKTLAASAAAGRIAESRGRVYHYRLVKEETLGARGASRYVIDCGFDNYVYPPEGPGRLSNKRVYRSARREEGYRLFLSDAVKDELYTYQVKIKRVVDADTLLARVDCGFGLFHEERLRLRGINAPELSTIAGMKAKARVEEILTPCGIVVVKTYTSDKYGRYVADIFYLAGERDPAVIAARGTFLNQRLLDEGLAQVYE